MVEFGLKLEDNKVSEWIEFYIDYDKLKALLKKAKATEKKYEDLAKRRPVEAEKIKEAYKSGNTASVITTPAQSAMNLTKVVEETTERTSLLALSPTRDPENNDTETTDEGTTGYLASAFDMSGYFGSRYERNIRDYLKEIDDQGKEFEETLLSEIKKVSDFYASKIIELETRFQLLVEAVASSYDIDPLPSLGAHSDSQLPIRWGHRVQKSAIMELVSRISVMIKEESKKKKDNWAESLQVADDNSDDEGDTNTPTKRNKKAGEADSIKRALIDHYRSAKLLHNFVIMNYTGFIKIVKKHDKSIPEQKGRFKQAIDPKNLFDEGKEVEELSNRFEKYFANWFCEGDMRAAHAQMLPKRGDGLDMDWSQLRLGYRMGMCAMLALWVCWDCIWGLLDQGNATIGGREAFPVFRACGGLLCLQWFWGCSVFVWTRFRVNYIYLFDFNPRIVATSIGIFEEAVDNTLVYMGLMLIYYKSGVHDIPQIIPAGGYPFILVLYTLYKLIFPLRTRAPMWHSVWRVVSAPMHAPSFFDGYVGDIFTSMVKVFQDIAWTIGWMVSGDFLISEDLMISTRHDWASSHWYMNVLIPIICLLPLVFRFNQCLRRYFDTGDRFPHLANATKYALSQTVTLFGAFHPLYLEYTYKKREGEFNAFQIFWLIIFVTSSLYSFAWDVYMDWGLGGRKYGFLGGSLMYPRRSYYYTVICLDLVLRFMWVLTLVPPQSGAKFEVPQYLSAVTMMLELFRRTLWGFLRLENEHRSNAAGFRRVGFVPLHFNTGHKHSYTAEKEHRGRSVLAEVVAVTICVLGVCIFSVVSAQRATRHSSTMEMLMNHKEL